MSQICDIFYGHYSKRSYDRCLVDDIGPAHVLEAPKRGDLMKCKKCKLDDPFDGLQQR